jgi:hypothetical protein
MEETLRVSEQFLDERFKFFLCMLILANTPKASVTVGL